MMKDLVAVVCLLLSVSATLAFQLPGHHMRPVLALRQAGQDNEGRGGWNMQQQIPKTTKTTLLEELGDMFSRVDDVIDDFMGKRMGNGEVFYGKRKYKPSGREHTEGEYNGMGLSDKLRIDITRQRKEEYLARKQQEQQRLEP